MKKNGALRIFVLLTFLIIFSGCVSIRKEDLEEKRSSTKEATIQVNGVFPKMAVMAKGVGSDSEAGIGALIPWADKLWAIGYVSHIKGKGIGLYEISDDMTMRMHPASVTGTFANRMAHWSSAQAFIGPYAIDAEGSVRTIEALKGFRLTATVRHLTDPANKVYFLGMEGGFWEVDVHTLEAKKLFNLVKELEIPPGAQPHFKGAFSTAGRVVVANNTYEEAEFLGKRQGGCLGAWDGKKWTVVERNPFIGVGGGGGRGYGGGVIFATGWNKSSVILRVFNRRKWSRYLLPKASHRWDHTWNTEWMRIRHAQTERFLMDVHGMFYDLPALIYEGAPILQGPHFAKRWQNGNPQKDGKIETQGRVWGIRPICTHLRVVPDFCYWRGLFVMAGDQIDHDEGQPQSGLWFGNIDDLWQMGKPSGWGGPWWQTPVEAGTVSDPFLMTGFDKKVVHLAHDSDKHITFKIEVDFLGNGTWKEYKTVVVPANGYVHHEFTDGFSAHWVRVSVDTGCKATVYFMYN